MGRFGWLLLALMGCYDGFQTEEEQLKLKATDVVTGSFSGFYPDSPVLLGTEICVEVACGLDDSCPGNALVPACFADSASGSVVRTERACVVADSVGSGRWSWDPVPCDANAAGYAPVADGVNVEVVDGDGVVPRLDQWVEALAPEFAVLRGAPKDWVVPAGGSYRLAQGGRLLLPVVLEHPDFDAPVAWNDAAADVFAVSIAGELAQVTRRGGGMVELRTTAGSRSDLRFAYPGLDGSLGELVGVRDQPSEIDVAVAYDSDSGAPMGARALVRDASGELYYGSEVTWTVLEGDLAVEPGGDLPGQDYASFSDACLAPPDRGGPRTAVLSVSRGDVSTEFTLDWVGHAGEEDPNWVEDPLCQHGSAGCGCDSGGRQGIIWLWSGAAVFALRRRSRVRR